ncbi:unnamed protein product, partial [Closterium sp. Yama58-4]
AAPVLPPSARRALFDPLFLSSPLPSALDALLPLLSASPSASSSAYTASADEELLGGEDGGRGMGGNGAERSEGKGVGNGGGGAAAGGEGMGGGVCERVAQGKRSSIARKEAERLLLLAIFGSLDGPPAQAVIFETSKKTDQAVRPGGLEGTPAASTPPDTCPNVTGPGSMQSGGLHRFLVHLESDGCTCTSAAPATSAASATSAAGWRGEYSVERVVSHLASVTDRASAHAPPALHAPHFISSLIRQALTTTATIAASRSSSPRPSSPPSHSTSVFPTTSISNITKISSSGSGSSVCPEAFVGQLVARLCRRGHAATVAFELVHTIIRQLAHTTSAPTHTSSSTSSTTCTNSTSNKPTTTCHSSSSFPHLPALYSTIIASLAAADAFSLHQLTESLLSHLAALSAALPTTAPTASSSSSSTTTTNSTTTVTSSGCRSTRTGSSSARTGSSSVPETVLRLLFQGLLAERHPQAVYLFTSHLLTRSLLPFSCLPWIVALLSSSSSSASSSGPSTDDFPALEPMGLCHVALEHVLRMWSSPALVQSASMEKQIYVTAAAGFLLSLPRRHHHEALSSSAHHSHAPIRLHPSLLTMLLKGVSMRLESPLPLVRLMGQRLAFAFSVAVHPDRPPMLFGEFAYERGIGAVELTHEAAIAAALDFARGWDIGGVTGQACREEGGVGVKGTGRDGGGDENGEVEEGGGEERDVVEEDCEEDESEDGESEGGSEGEIVEEWSEEDWDEEEEESEEESDEEEEEDEGGLGMGMGMGVRVGVSVGMSGQACGMPAPMQLRYCAADLRKADDVNAMERALLSLEPMIRCQPDELDDVAAELARSLIHMQCQFLLVGEEGEGEAGEEGEEESGSGSEEGGGGAVEECEVEEWSSFSNMDKYGRERNGGKLREGGSMQGGEGRGGGQGPGGAEERRRAALVALVVFSPVASLEVLLGEVFSAHVDLSQRLLILDVLEAAAIELASYSSSTSSSSHASSSHASSSASSSVTTTLAPPLSASSLSASRTHTPLIVEIHTGPTPWDHPAHSLSPSPPGAGKWVQLPGILPGDLGQPELAKAMLAPAGGGGGFGLTGLTGSWTKSFARDLPRRPGDRILGQEKRTSKAIEFAREKLQGSSGQNQQEHSQRDSSTCTAPRVQFADVAAGFMLPLMRAYDRQSHGVDWVGRDFVVLARVLLLLGKCLRLLSPSPAVLPLAAALLEFLNASPIAQHPEPYVQRCAIFASASLLLSLPAAAVAAEGLLLSSAASATGGTTAIGSEGGGGGAGVGLSGMLRVMAVWLGRLAEESGDEQTKARAFGCLQLYDNFARACLQAVLGTTPT